MRLPLSLALASTLVLFSQTGLGANLNTTLAALEKQSQQMQQEIAVLKKQAHANKRYSKTATRSHFVFGNGITVTTSPLTGQSANKTPADILQQNSSMNEDLSLLKQRQVLMNTLQKTNDTISRPIIEFSGALEGQMYYNSDSLRSDSRDLGINLATAELDTQAIINPWASGFMAISYNGAPISSGNREPDSTISLQRGFATIGNLNKFPVYFTIGKMVVPFGQYSSALTSTPLTRSMARIISPAAVLGYSHNGLNVLAFGYSGSQTSGDNDIIKQGGARVGYTIQSGNNSYSINASYVTNIADSQGMQGTGVTPTFHTSEPPVQTNFTGFAQKGNTIKHRVAAADLSAKASFGPISLTAEYMSALRHFAKSDLSFDTNAARPQSLNTEIAYSTEIKNTPVSFGLVYGHTWQALALNLPQNTFAAVAQASVWNDTVESIEYRHDIDYGKTVAANGGGAKEQITGTGKNNNSVIMQLGIYF